MRRSIILAMMIAVTLLTTGCQTQVVPPGTVVIKLESGGDSEIYTEGSFTAWGGTGFTS